MKSLKKQLSILLSLLILFGAATTVSASAQTTNELKPSFLPGDANDDGAVTVSDVTDIQRKLAGYAVAPFNEITADVDKDGAVTIQDATLIQSKLADMPSPPDDEKLDNDALYDIAVRDSVFADNDELLPLVNISRDDDRVIWNGDKVLMGLVHKYPDIYPDGEDVTLKWGDVWVFSAGEMYQWINSNGNGVNDWQERLEQLLGLPEWKNYTSVTTVWVDADLLHRPANVADPTAAMELTYKPTGDDEFDAKFKSWYDSTILWSYFNEIKYPWTRLGYTYDWADNGKEYGLSEFILFSGETVSVDHTCTINEFVVNVKAKG